MPVALWRHAVMKLFEGLRTDGVSDLGAYMYQHPDFLNRARDATIIEEVNDRTVQMFGARDAGEMTTRTSHWWMSPDTYRRILEARFRGEPTFQEETRIVTPDGRAIDVFMTAVRPEVKNDWGISIVGFIDISELIRAREMLQRVQAEFAHAARVSMLGELTASVAHEVNQPLAAMRTNGETALRWLGRSEADVPKARALIRHIVDDGSFATSFNRRASPYLSIWRRRFPRWSATAPSFSR